jgi:hypothetical protein
MGIQAAVRSSSPGHAGVLGVSPSAGTARGALHALWAHCKAFTQTGWGNKSHGSLIHAFRGEFWDKALAYFWQVGVEGACALRPPGDRGVFWTDREGVADARGIAASCVAFRDL